MKKDETTTGPAEGPGTALVEAETTDSRLPAGYMTADSSLAVALSRAEVDQQIATAKAFPRKITLVRNRILELATLDEDTAEECMYALPRAGKAINGPSVRLAEIIASQWGNGRLGARVVHVDRIEKYVEAEGVFHDLETNMATTARVRRRISDKNGRLFNDDMILVTGNAASAIAKRNAILGGVPKAIWRGAYEAVQRIIRGDIKTLGERRERAVAAFATYGITPDQVFAALGVPGMEDIKLDHLELLTGMRSAIKNNESSVEEMFPPVAKPGAAPKTLGGRLDALAAGSKGKTTESEGDAASVEQAGTAEPTAETVASPAAAVSDKPAEADSGNGLASSSAAEPVTQAGDATPPASRRSAKKAKGDAPAPDEGGAATEAAAPPSDPADDEPLTKSERAFARQYSDSLAMSAAPIGIVERTRRIIGEEWPTKKAFSNLLGAIRDAHTARVKGERSIQETDEAITKIFANDF